MAHRNPALPLRDSRRSLQLFVATPTNESSDFVNDEFVDTWTAGSASPWTASPGSVTSSTPESPVTPTPRLMQQRSLKTPMRQSPIKTPRAALLKRKEQFAPSPLRNTTSAKEASTDEPDPLVVAIENERQQVQSLTSIMLQCRSALLSLDQDLALHMEAMESMHQMLQQWAQLWTRATLHQQQFVQWMTTPIQNIAERQAHEKTLQENIKPTRNVTTTRPKSAKLPLRRPLHS